MRTHRSRRRDFQGLEQRRKQAGRLFAAGKMTLAEIARELKVSRQSVSRWYTEWRRGGASALHGAGRAGRKPKLDRKQMRQVEKVLRQGARSQGFGTDLWTLPSVASVIERVTEVRYHPGHVWKVLGAIDWALQRPSKHAERDPVTARFWLQQRWPAVKQTLSPGKSELSSKQRASSRKTRQSVAPGRRKPKRPSYR